MSHVILIVALNVAESTCYKDHNSGRYVSAYDPNRFNGMGFVKTVPLIKDAIKFASQAEAITFYRQSSTVRPLREDGQPNRPLTAYTVCIMDEAEAAANEV